MIMLKTPDELLRERDHRRDQENIRMQQEWETFYTGMRTRILESFRDAQPFLTFNTEDDRTNWENSFAVDTYPIELVGPRLSAIQKDLNAALKHACGEKYEWKCINLSCHLGRLNIKIQNVPL